MKPNPDDEIAKRFKEEFDNAQEEPTEEQGVPHQIVAFLAKLMMDAMKHSHTTNVISEALSDECREHMKQMSKAASSISKQMDESTAYAACMSFIHKMYLKGKIKITKGGDENG